MFNSAEDDVFILGSVVDVRQREITSSVQLCLDAGRGHSTAGLSTGRRYQAGACAEGSTAKK